MGVTLNHTGFVVADIDEAIKFYCDGIGLTVRFQVEVSDAPALSQLLGYEDVHVKAAFVGGDDGHSLEIIEYVHPKTEIRDAAEQHRRNVTGGTHLAFNVRDMDAVLARMRERCNRRRPALAGSGGRTSHHHREGIRVARTTSQD